MGAPEGASNLVIVGYTAEAIPDLGNYIEMPTAPSNYGADAVAKWEKEKGPDARMNTLFSSAFSKLTGHITDIVAIDLSQRDVFFSSDDKEKAPALSFMAWLLSNHPTAYSIATLPRERVTIMGLDPKPFVRVCGMECRLAKSVPAAPLRFWYLDEECYDPYAMLVESERRKILSIQSMLKMTGMSAPPKWQAHQDAKCDAFIAQHLISRLGLFPRDEEEQAKLVQKYGKMLWPYDANGDPKPLKEAAKKSEPATVSV